MTHFKPLYRTYVSYTFFCLTSNVKFVQERGFDYETKLFKSKIFVWSPRQVYCRLDFFLIDFLNLQALFSRLPCIICRFQATTRLKRKPVRIVCDWWFMIFLNEGLKFYILDFTLFYMSLLICIRRFRFIF